jgi:DNA polymerase-3 subunit chi
MSGYTGAMAKLELHRLAGDKRALDLAKLVERLYQGRRRLVIWMADDGRRQILDDYLWTFRKLSFVPHQLWESSLGAVEEAVVLVGEPANPNRADVLIVGDDLPPGEWAASFAEVHDLVPQGTAGEQRRAWWQAWQEEQKG